MITQINQYLAKRGRASASDISLHFGIAPDALSGMLELLQSKGRVRALPADEPSCGSSCSGCSFASCAPQIWESLRPR